MLLSVISFSNRNRADLPFEGIVSSGKEGLSSG